MSAVSGVQQTKIDAGGLSNMHAEGVRDGRVKVIVDSYEAAALATSSTIKMGGVLPAGARILGFTLAYDNISTVSLSVGDSASAARYLASFDTAATAGIKNEILVDGLDYVVGTASGDNQIIISTTGVSAATGTIKLAVFYSKD